MLEGTIVDVVDTDSGEVEWTGSIEDFMAANEDSPLSPAEMNELETCGAVHVGGGAAGRFTIRCATA